VEASILVERHDMLAMLSTEDVPTAAAVMPTVEKGEGRIAGRAVAGRCGRVRLKKWRQYSVQ